MDSKHNEQKSTRYANLSQVKISKPAKSSKKLSLVNAPSASSSTTRTPTKSESIADVERENLETTILRRLLLNKRSELANVADCMPYLVASNEVLSQLAIRKPTSIYELRNEHCK